MTKLIETTGFILTLIVMMFVGIGTFLIMCGMNVFYTIQFFIGNIYSDAKNVIKIYKVSVVNAIESRKEAKKFDDF